jgi:hypothetical protein
MPTETFKSGTTGSISIGLSQTVTIECWGGEGAHGELDHDNGSERPLGGEGGYIKAEVDVSAGDTLYIRFTEGGSGKTLESDEDKDGNSATASTGPGGTSSSVRLNGTSLNDRVVVAGGGGSTASITNTALSGSVMAIGSGGDGGPLQGEDGSDATDSSPTTAQGGDGGTQSSGFSQGTGEAGTGTIDGSGGDAAIGIAGSGGAGYYGGFAGETKLSRSSGNYAVSGGGGGSNFSSGNIITNQRGNNRDFDDQAAEVKVQYETGFPIYIDGNQAKEITIDGQKVSNVSIDGTTL